MNRFIVTCVLLTALGRAETNTLKDLPERIDRSSLKYFPFVSNNTPYDGKLPSVPTGCADFQVECPREPVTPQVVKAIDFGFSKDIEDCVPAVNRAIAHCKETGATRLELAPGTYRCFGSEGIILNGIKDLTLDGKGAYAESTGPETLDLVNRGGAQYIHAVAGDEVELFNADYTPAGFKAEITAVNGSRIKLSRPHPGAEEYIIQKTAFRTRNILLRDCEFTNYAGRGIMQTSDVTIENCLFENGIRIPLRFQRAFSMNAWAEGYGCGNVIVRNCDFINSMCTQPLYGITHDIFAGSRRLDDASGFDKKLTASDIMIENCFFKNVVGMVFYANYADSVTFRDNTFSVSDASDAESYAGCTFFENADNISFVNNIIISDADVSAGAFVAPDCKNITVAGNKLRRTE
ncbi:MAG: right-handed parallel beta-helix repeat-containing protein [Kiritimatiellia bacterium]